MSPTWTRTSSVNVTMPVCKPISQLPVPVHHEPGAVGRLVQSGPDARATQVTSVLRWVLTRRSSWMTRWQRLGHCRGKWDNLPKAQWSLSPPHATRSAQTSSVFVDLHRERNLLTRS
jgi:hypothetical protein